jgi:hypothetical protein
LPFCRYLSLLSTSLLSVLKLLLPDLHARHQTLSTLKTPTAKDIHAVSEIFSTLNYLESQAHYLIGTKALSSALFSLYTYLSYTHKIPNPALNSPFFSERERYELRMKPFLTITGMGVPAFEEYIDAVQPWGPFTSPSVNLALIAPAFFAGIDGMVKEARVAFAEMRKLGPVAARAEGVEGWWGKNVGALLASCVASGVAVAGVRGVVAKGGESGMSMESPECGKRYHDWWVIPKISSG